MKAYTMSIRAKHLLASFLVVFTWLPAASLLADWPQANGPFGNFMPRRYGHDPVDDLNRAPLVWESEDRDLGYAKGSSSGYVRHLAQREGHPLCNHRSGNIRLPPLWRAPGPSPGQRS